MIIEIPVGKGRPVKAVQSSKLSNELGIIAQNFLTLPNKWKELTKEEKDVALIRYHKRCHVNKINRSKLKCNHIMASKVFVVARAEISEEHEGMELDKIDFYKSTHYSTEKGWSSKQAEANYNSMNDLKALYTSGESSITIDETVDVVLDKSWDT
ncbi:hypothetical protein BC332_25606 [Capsicum chinense]|nr:hypothetical protein BC332_25606 [Capsicum chinense]